MANIKVSQITAADIPGAIECIQQAFADDPYGNWVFDRTSPHFLTRNRMSLRIRCEWGIETAIFQVAKDQSAESAEGRNKVVGVACWLKPKPQGEPETWNEWYQGWLLWTKQVWMNIYYGRAGLNVKRYYIWKQRQAEAQAQLWDDPSGYYFCNVLVVLPSEQGKGIGKKLVKSVTDLADKEGRKCYLESDREVPNTAIYERLGFKKVKEMSCEDDGAVCKLYCMIREPKAEADENAR